MFSEEVAKNQKHFAPPQRNVHEHRGVFLVKKNANVITNWQNNFATKKFDQNDKKNAESRKGVKKCFPCSQTPVELVNFREKTGVKSIGLFLTLLCKNSQEKKHQLFSTREFVGECRKMHGTAESCGQLQ